MNVDINTKLIKIINVVYPKPTPKINGKVFLMPKLKPEYAATALFGPGVNPNDKEIPISSNNSGCIKIKLSEVRFQILEMDEQV